MILFSLDFEWAKQYKTTLQSLSWMEVDPEKCLKIRLMENDCRLNS